MRVLGPIATTLLVLACGTFQDDIAPPTIDPVKQAEIDRLRMIERTFRSVGVDVGKGHGIAGTDSLARTVNYSVILRNHTPDAHVVTYSVYWTARTFVPSETGVCSQWQRIMPFPREIRADRLRRTETLQPLEWVVKPGESSPIPDCFDIEPSSGHGVIDEIDGLDYAEAEYRIAELEGREIEY
jgi:hypothetical protein